MAGVLLILSNVRMAPSVTERAISEAKRLNEDLIILVALDPNVANKVASQFLESGYIGPRTQDGFLQSLYERHEQLFLQAADEVVRNAESAGVAVRSVVRRGDYDTETAEVIQLEQPSTVVIEKRKRSLLRFVIADAFIDDLAKRFSFRLMEV